MGRLPSPSLMSGQILTRWGNLAFKQALCRTPYLPLVHFSLLPEVYVVILEDIILICHQKKVEDALAIELLRVYRTFLSPTSLVGWITISFFSAGIIFNGMPRYRKDPEACLKGTCP